MKYDYKGMRIYVQKNYDEVSKKASQILASQITLNPKSILGLATGSTPEGMYKCLVDMYKNDVIDFSEITTFNLDEYLGIAPDNNQSYSYYMNEHLFNHVNINRDYIHIPSSETGNVAKTCSSYDDMIFQVGKIDLQVLGIGNNGHIGFNEPDVHFEAGTHLVNLDEMTIKANARFFNSIDDVPKQAISMGIRNIMQSSKVILIATGETKIDAITKMLFGDITPNLPASILQVHNDFTLIVDNIIGEVITKNLISNEW